VRRRKRVFKQARARETYESILRAAAKVFAKRGFDKAQAPDIARAAGVSTGAVYRYFKDKREIFLEMIDDELRRAREEVERAIVGMQSVDLRAAIDEVLEVFFARALQDPALTRVYLAMSFSDPDVAALRAEVEAHDRDVLAALIGASVPTERIGDPRAAAFVVQSAAIAVAADCALRREIPIRAAKAELASLIHRYFADQVSASR